MRIRQTTHGLAIALSLAVALTWTATAQPIVEGTARVLRIEGSAHWREGDGDWRTVTPGTTLKPGSTIKTGDERGTFVDLVLSESGAPLPVASPPRSDKPFPATLDSYQPAAEHDVVRLWENSRLKLDKLSYVNPGISTVTETQLELTSGRLTGRARKLTPGSTYEIKLASGLAGIKGTLYDISAEGVVRVLEGTMAVAYFDAITGNVVTQFIHAGQMFDLRSALLSYLTNAQRTELEKAGRSLTVWKAQRRAIYYPDRTIEFVSPGTGLAR